jgi:hypothetical protein
MIPGTNTTKSPSTIRICRTEMDRKRSQRCRIDLEIHEAYFRERQWDFDANGDVLRPKIAVRWRLHDICTIKDRAKTNLLHYAARHSDLKAIPPRLFSQKHLLAKCGYDGDTVFHVAAFNGSLRFIPAQFLTEENLLKNVNNRGETVLHAAAKRDWLHHIPNRFISPQTLRLADEEGTTVAHVAISPGNINQLDRRHLTPEVLLAADSRGKTPLHNAVGYNGSSLGYIPTTQELADHLREIRAIIDPLALEFHYLVEPDEIERRKQSCRSWLVGLSKLALRKPRAKRLHQIVG